MSFTFRPATRENVSLLIGLAGGTGSGKTYSAMRLATGLSNGKSFAMIDTENGRGLHYADQFKFDHGSLAAPFRPEAYADAIEAAAAAGYGVILVDSFSHEHAGEGGLLDWHEEEFERLGGRDTVKMTAWIKPKMAHKEMVNRLLQVNAHIILCFRAEEKIEIVKVDGKTVVRPKTTLTGLDGWVPVCEKTLPYELTLSFLLTADAPGVPKPIKLQEQHRAFFALDRPVSEETGAALAEWAAGSSLSEPDGHGAQGDPATVAQSSPVDGAVNVKQPSGPESEGNGAGLSKRAFVNGVKDAGLSREAIAEVGQRLFPGKSVNSLTDAERGELWASLSGPDVGSPTSLSSGAGASERNPGLHGSGSESEGQTALALPASVRRNMETGQ